MRQSDLHPVSIGAVSHFRLVGQVKDERGFECRLGRLIVGRTRSLGTLGRLVLGSLGGHRLVAHLTQLLQSGVLRLPGLRHSERHTRALPGALGHLHHHILGACARSVSVRDPLVWRQHTRARARGDRAAAAAAAAGAILL